MHLVGPAQMMTRHAMNTTSIPILSCMVASCIFRFPSSTGTDFWTCQSYSSRAFATGAFHLQRQDAAIKHFSKAFPVVGLLVFPQMRSTRVIVVYCAFRSLVFSLTTILVTRSRLTTILFDVFYYYLKNYCLYCFHSSFFSFIFSFSFMCFMDYICLVN